MNLDKKIEELKSSRTPFVIATIVRCEGSSPRHVGSKMLVTAETSFGTVGGGGVEHQAIEDAKKLIKKRVSECIKYDLTASGIQPCGGNVEIFFEVVAPKKKMLVFGAGHVGEALCPMLAAMDYEVTLVDERKERIDLPTFNCVFKKVCELPQKVLPTIDFSDELYLICLTHKHIHDEEIIEFCLRKPFKYLGLISSRSKWKYFCDKYRGKDFTDKDFERVSTPIGLDIGAETPFEIAVAICAELIQKTYRA